MNQQHDPVATAHWDAGDAGCGRLIMELRSAVQRLRDGEILQVTATDAAAPVDIWVWCGMTGNRLLCERHPVYFVQRRAG